MPTPSLVVDNTRPCDDHDTYDYWKRRDLDLQYKYNITLEQYRILLNKQGNKCAICSKVLTNTFTTHVDHSHRTGKVRGILCVGCNHVLGKMKDSVELLQRAINYLQLEPQECDNDNAKDS